MRQVQAFEYCLRCGAKAQLKDNHLACQACGLNFYLNPKACTSVVLQNSAGKYLFVKRAVEPKKGYWDFPGGFAEEGEDFEECSRREVKEELGIEIGDLQYLATHKDHYDHLGVSYGTIGVSYLASFPEGAKLQPADDVSDYKFFSLDEIPTDMLAFPSMREMFEEAAKFKA